MSKRKTLKDLEESHRQDMILALDDIKKLDEKVKNNTHEIYKHLEILKTIRKDATYCLNTIRLLKNEISRIKYQKQQENYSKSYYYQH